MHMVESYVRTVCVCLANPTLLRARKHCQCALLPSSLSFLLGQPSVGEPLLVFVDLHQGVEVAPEDAHAAEQTLRQLGLVLALESERQLDRQGSRGTLERAREKKGQEQRRQKEENEPSARRANTMRAARLCAFCRHPHPPSSSQLLRVP